MFSSYLPFQNLWECEKIFRNNGVISDAYSQFSGFLMENQRVSIKLVFLNGLIQGQNRLQRKILQAVIHF